MFEFMGSSNNNAANPLNGKSVAGGKFLVYTYTIKFEGTVASIRAFFDSLSMAYKDNRVYNIRDVVLTRELEEENIKITYKKKHKDLFFKPLCFFILHFNL